MVEYEGIPIIVVLTYIACELYKILFQNKKEAYKYIPILTSIIGGLLGSLIYLTHPEMIFNASNIYIAMLIGIISGSSATGTNQIIKQIFKHNEKKG